MAAAVHDLVVDLDAARDWHEAHEVGGIRIGEIDHGHGFKTRYAHLRDIQVQPGEHVAIGQRIGSMGSTGRSTATHLHYEVWFRGRAVDPVNFLRAGRHVHEQG